MHFATQHRGTPTRLDHRLALALTLHDWPSNVRELAAVVERLMVECGDADQLRPSSSQLQRLGLSLRAAAPAESLMPTPTPKPPARTDRPDAAALEAGLLACNGSMKALAAQLGVGRNTLYRWFAAAGLEPKQVRGGGSQDT
jgi:transcriptional regulator of acetoin/glycerol metabolism